jgi:RHS repeat-associated protein
VYAPNTDVTTNATSNRFTLIRGIRKYELSNWLGNVQVVISDKKIPICNNSQTPAYYEADVLSAKDYYPFGMTMTQRGFDGGSYKFGFNGQEKTDEISGNGNHYTAEYWEMDPRIARRWNTDPVIKYHESPYAILGNNPIWFADPLGSDTITFNKSSWSAPAPKSGLDGVQFPAPGGSSNSIDVRVAEGKDVFFYTQSHTNYDEDGNATTTSSTQQFYPVEDHKNGITETPYAFGLLSYKDNDRLTLAKLAPTELLDYLAGKSTGWDNLAYRGAKALQSSYGVFEFAKTISEVTVGFGGFSLGTRSLTALRTVRSGEIYNFGAEAAMHMANPGRRVPLQLMDDVIRNTKGFADPQGSSALMYYSKMYRNGKAYNLEILYDKASNSIWHFKYK